MNDKRRSKLCGAIKLLNEVELVIEKVLEEEEGCIDNYPENLQGTEKYESMEDSAEDLRDALEGIGEAREHISSAMER